MYDRVLNTSPLHFHTQLTLYNSNSGGERKKNRIMEKMELWEVELLHEVLKIVLGSQLAEGREYRVPEAKQKQKQQQVFSIEIFFD